MIDGTPLIPIFEFILLESGKNCNLTQCDIMCHTSLKGIKNEIQSLKSKASRPIGGR